MLKYFHWWGEGEGRRRSTHGRESRRMSRHSVYNDDSRRPSRRQSRRQSIHNNGRQSRRMSRKSFRGSRRMSVRPSMHGGLYEWTNSLLRWWFWLKGRRQNRKLYSIGLRKKGTDSNQNWFQIRLWITFFTLGVNVWFYHNARFQKKIE